MASKATTIVRVETLPNQTPSGRPSATGARRLAQYFAYGRGTQAEQATREQRGGWISEEGRRLEHEEVIEWVNQQGKAHRFTHQLILSARDARLSPEEFAEALKAGDLLQEWRLIAHEDSNYPHAHVLAFGDEPSIARGREFQEWCLAVRRALKPKQEQQLQYQQEKQWQLALNERVRQAEKELSLGQGLEL
jgi:hypothetical protein